MARLYRNIFMIAIVACLLVQMPELSSFAAKQESTYKSPAPITQTELLNSLKKTAAKANVLTPEIAAKNQPISREDAAKMVQHLFHLLDASSPFSDVPDYNPYAGAVGAVYKARLMEGKSSSKFGYGSTLTQAEAANLNKKVNLYLKNREKGYKPFKVASIEFNPQMHEIDKNVDTLYRKIENAFKKGAKLAVAPEMATTGYMYQNRQEIAPYVETLPGKTTDKFSKLAKKYDAYIVYGMAEKDPDTDLYYNSAALIGPEGYIGKYRKTHLAETDEYWAAWGNLGVPVFATKIGNIAINICMDSAYYESARLAAVSGADILAFPTNSSGQAVAALPARAMQNGLYIVSANRSDTERDFHMVGTSAIWSPEGKKLAETPYIPKNKKSSTVIATAEVDPKNYHNANKSRLWERHPNLYKEITMFIAPWDSYKSTESKNVTASTLQYEPKVGDKRANQIKIEQLLKVKAEEAKKKNTPLNLVVLPELSLTGPAELLSSTQIRSSAETNKGTTFRFMSKLAKKYNTAIVYGIIESKEKKLYNTAILIDQEGNEVGKYRKTHLSSQEKSWASAGDQLPVFKTKTLGKIGMLINDDVAFPESAGVMAVKRADMIAIPSAWNGQYGGEMEINSSISKNPYPAGSMPLWDAVAIGAESYTVVANYVGTKKGYKGRSALYTLDPLYGLDQPVVASNNKEEGLLFHFKTLQSKWGYNQEKLINSRRTDYYTPLIME